MKYIYVVQTNIPIREVQEKLELVSPDTSVDYPYDVLFLDEERREVGALVAAGARKGAILNVACRRVNFENLNRSQCPLCEEDMTQDQLEDRRCPCGFAWSDFGMWMNEKESPGA